MSILGSRCSFMHPLPTVFRHACLVSIVAVDLVVGERRSCLPAHAIGAVVCNIHSAAVAQQSPHRAHMVARDVGVLCMQMRKNGDVS